MIDNLKQIFSFLDECNNAKDIVKVLEEVFPLKAVYISDTTTDTPRDLS